MAAMTPLIITKQSVLAPLRAKICDNGAGQTMLPDIIIVNIQTDLNTYGTDGAFPTSSKAPYMEAQMVVLRNSLKSGHGILFFAEIILHISLWPKYWKNGE